MNNQAKIYRVKIAAPKQLRPSYNFTKIIINKPINSQFMIPTDGEMMLLILEILRDGKEHHRKELIDPLVEQFNTTTEEELNKKYPSSNVIKIHNLAAWTTAEMHKAGLIERPGWGRLKITAAGADFLNKNIEKLNRWFLRENFFKYQKWKDDLKNKKSEEDTFEHNPYDIIENGCLTIRKNVESDLHEKIIKNDPRFFEELVLDLLEKMGYGIKYKILGQTRDGGVDGMITEDKLSLDEIYLQAKRWSGPVPISQVRDFASALLGKKSKKGIFITTSDFTRDTYEYVKSLTEVKVILMNGKELVKHMYDNNVGVNPDKKYEIKKIDNNYFGD